MGVFGTVFWGGFCSSVDGSTWFLSSEEDAVFRDVGTVFWGGFWSSVDGYR